VTELFGRKYRLQVDTLVIEGLDIEFEVEKSLDGKTPNSADVRIWNLNADHRKALQGLEKVYVSLEAGYESGMSLLFRGDLRDAASARDGADWITQITSDSGRRARRARLAKSFAPASSVSDVLQAAAKAMGVRLGNTAAKAAAAKIRGTQAAKAFNGYALAGQLERELDRICRACGLEWSIQDDELQLLDAGAPLQEIGIKLTPETGMVGSPEPGTKGAVNVTCLMIPDVYPGRRIQLESQHINGVFRVQTSKHSGTTADRRWYIDLELRDEEHAP
jgi:hypothetical protein